MNYKLLMQKQLDKMKMLFSAAEAENRVLTDDEQNQYDTAEAEFKRLENLKTQAEKLENMSKSIPAAKVEEPASASESITNQTRVVAENSTKAPYNSLGEQLKDVAAVKHGSGESLDRLKNANLNTETGADGGFLIAPDFLGGLLKDAEAESQLYSRATKMNLKGNTASIPGVDEKSRQDGQRHGGISVQWVAEGQAGNFSKTSFQNNDVKLSKLVGLVKITSEMMEDSPLLTSWVQRSFPTEMAFQRDLSVYNGDGNGKPLGFMKSNALVTVAKESGQTAATIVYENIVKMWARMPMRSQMKSAWFITQRAQEQLPLMNLSVGTGGLPVYLPPGGASEAPYGTLFGRPVIAIEQAAALGAKGDIVLADLTDYNVFEKGGVKTARSIHVDFDKDVEAFRFTQRANGAPYTQSKLQSYSDSTFYTSPYITLEAR